jgi:hypothetical protein
LKAIAKHLSILAPESAGTSIALRIARKPGWFSLVFLVYLVSLVCLVDLARAIGD